ncbi:MAG: rhodanese-like domain-containing protein [Nanoarchaeota archaeon]
MKKIILLTLTLVILVSACTNSTEPKTYVNLDPAEFNELIKDESVFVLDSHIPEQQHIKGTDAFIPFNEIELNLGSLPEDKFTPIAVYCRSGSMSVVASEKLYELGYTNVYNLVGGANAWRLSGYEFEV